MDNLGEFCHKIIRGIIEFLVGRMQDVQNSIVDFNPILFERLIHHIAGRCSSPDDHIAGRGSSPDVIHETAHYRKLARRVVVDEGRDASWCPPESE